MKSFLIAAVVLACLPVLARTASERQWQSGTITDAGVKRDLTVGEGAAGSRPFGPPTSTGRQAVPEVATYVIETQREHFEVKDVLPLGGDTLNLTPGDPVTFAVEKRTVYIRGAKGREYRFRLTKRTLTPAP